MDPWILPALGLFSALGSASAGGQAAAANQAQAEQTQFLTDFMKQQKGQIYDPLVEPIYTQTVIPTMLARATNPPPFAGDVLAEARRLQQPFNI